MDNIYSNNRLLCHLGRLAAISNCGHTTPVRITMHITDTCNQRCNYCPFRRSKTLIPYDKFLSILADAVSNLRIKSIIFSGGGEPTTHPDHVNMFRLAAINYELDCGLFTNGFEISDACLEVLQSFQWVRISVDAATPETYASNRHVSLQAFDKVISNISMLRQACKYVGINYVVTKNNYEEIVKAALLFHKLHVNHIRFAIDKTDLSQYESIYYKIRENILDTMALHSDLFQIYDGFDLILDTPWGLKRSNTVPDYSQCYYQQLAIAIDADLTVYRCCSLLGKPKGILGSLKNQLLSELWNDPNTLDAINTLYPIRDCLCCFDNNKNQLLNKLIVSQQSIPQKNFI